MKKVELDQHLQHLYCCSDTDLHVYDLAGKLLFKFERYDHTLYYIIATNFDPNVYDVADKLLFKFEWYAHTLNSSGYV